MILNLLQAGWECSVNTLQGANGRRERCQARAFPGAGARILHTVAVSVVKATIAQCPLSVGLLLFLFTCQRPFPVVTWLSGSRPDFPLPASKRRSRQYGDRPLRTKEVNSTQMAAGAGSTQKWRLVTRLLGLPLLLTTIDWFVALTDFGIFLLLGE